MIDELNIDWTTLTKADMYTIIKQTEEQNIKLRKQYEAVIADYRSEVAKLRELVRDFDKCLIEAVRLAYIQGHATIYDDTLLASLHPRMRELGIEMS